MNCFKMPSGVGCLGSIPVAESVYNLIIYVRNKQVLSFKIFFQSVVEDHGKMSNITIKSIQRDTNYPESSQKHLLASRKSNKVVEDVTQNIYGAQNHSLDVPVALSRAR